VAAAGFLTYVSIRVAQLNDFIGLLIVLLIFFGPVSCLVGLLGVSIWGWVEALHVPEGLLHFACTGMMIPARAAIARGVSPNVRNYLGETPLLLAAGSGQGEMVKLLLLHGANPAVADMFGQTAISAARAKGHTDIADVISSATLRADLTTPQTLWQPNARLWLVACVTLGILLVMGLMYFSMRHPITAEQFLRLAEANQIRDVRWDGSYVVGELGERFQFSRDPIWLPSKRFWLLKTEDRTVEKKIPEYARFINPNYRSNLIYVASDELSATFWQNNWALMAILVWPVAFLAIPLWFVVRVQTYYTFSALSSLRRSAAPSEPSREASAPLRSDQG
jgi:hypothetical protein